MVHPRILVTGATGKTGGAIVARLREIDLPVRAIVRRRDGRSERLDRMGVETVVADLFDPDQMLDAMRGTARAYFLPTFDPFMIQSAAAFAVAARQAKLEAIVQMSQWLSSPDHPSLATRQTWLVDELFSNIPGVAHTILNPGFFADNFLRFADFASLLGVYPVLTGRSRSAPVSNEDIARLAAEILRDPDPHAGKRYRPTGPRLLSAYDMAAILQSVLGHRVRPVVMPMWLMIKAARLQGVEPFAIDGFRHYLEDHRRGTFAMDGGVNDTLRELTGTPGEEFEVTARRYTALPFTQKTLANRLTAIANFARTPVSPGWSLDRMARERGYPAVVNPRFSNDNPAWVASHARTAPIAVNVQPLVHGAFA